MGRQLAGHAGVDDAYPDICRGRKGVGAGATCEVSPHHRCRHGGRILRNAFFRQPVIAGEHEQDRLLQRCSGRMGDHAELYGQVFNSSKRAQRLGFAVNSRAHRCGKHLIDWSDCGDLPVGWDWEGHGFLVRRAFSDRRRRSGQLRLTAVARTASVVAMVTFGKVKKGSRCNADAAPATVSGEPKPKPLGSPGRRREATTREPGDPCRRALCFGGSSGGVHRTE